MDHWWQRNVVEPGKLPLLLTFSAFIVTFVVTRTITRLIRAGRGPFKNNISKSGVHVHHAVPGIVLLITGALLAIASDGTMPWLAIAGVLVGVGSSLVLDEFALILHLTDVYWAEEGRVSVEMVSLAVACMGFALVGLSPFAVDKVGPAELGVRLAGSTGVIVNMLLIAIAVLKGKFRFALIGAFVPVFSIIAAIRLARPGSRWARRYDSTRQQHAASRAARFDARWDPLMRRLGDVIGGTPTVELDERADRHRGAGTTVHDGAEVVPADARSTDQP